MGLLKRLFSSEKARLEDEILSGLLIDYHEELALAQQLRAHASAAPYPHGTEHLGRLAALAEKQAESLRTWIHRYGGTVAPVAGTPRGGRNHWARLVTDLDAVRAAGKRYLEQAIRFENSDPALGKALRDLEHEEQQHRVWIQDLVARADPHARN